MQVRKNRLDKVVVILEHLRMNKSLSMHVLESDWCELQRKTKAAGTKQSYVFRKLATCALREKPVPRSRERPAKLKCISIGVPIAEERQWRKECGINFRLWLCECVMPLIWTANLDEPLPEDIDRLPVSCEGPVIKLRVKESWKLAADGQWDTVRDWARKVLDVMAPHFVAHPRLFDIGEYMKAEKERLRIEAVKGIFS